ncbi:MAG TPA: Gfo/Idh/MocA family oxidoreductase, partial [Phycisphaerae bacterium]|nr:Gfo/Idh/MocA family oxidoreductase [Phycisphaerae bacterium]
MHIGFRGELTGDRRVRAGFIGCGSHSFRNVYPTFQFAPVELVAVCDLSIDKARAFAGQFGAGAAYDDYHQMLARGDLEAVFVVTNYDDRGRPRFPGIAVDCLRAGVHVWMEKPPAATCADIERIQAASAETGKHVLVGMKKMFFPANEKAKALMEAESFGRVQLATLNYPQYTPTVEELRRYLAGERVGPVVSFLDHLCHPVSLMLYLLGMPATLFYQRSGTGAAAATFTFPSGAVAVIQLTCGSAGNGGMERTMIVGDRGRHIVVDNNIRVTLVRPSGAGRPYGATSDYFRGPDEAGALAWEPEFSLGQLYNKGLFLLGYYGEVAEFARSVLEGRPPAKGTLAQAWQATRIFEAFAAGSGRVIPLDTPP